MPRLSLPCCLLIALAGCGDRNEAAAIRDEIRGDDYRNTYARAPGWEDDRQPSEGGPHGGFVNIYINDVVEDALAEGQPLERWPEGSLIVKDGFSAASGGDFEFFAFMERRDDGWFWGEYRGSSNRLVAAGLNDRQCRGCHAAGDDSVRAFELPQ